MSLLRQSTRQLGHGRMAQAKLGPFPRPAAARRTPLTVRVAPVLTKVSDISIESLEGKCLGPSSLHHFSTPNASNLSLSARADGWRSASCAPALVVPLCQSVRSTWDRTSDIQFDITAATPSAALLLRLDGPFKSAIETGSSAETQQALQGLRLNVVPGWVQEENKIDGRHAHRNEDRYVDYSEQSVELATDTLKSILERPKGQENVPLHIQAVFDGHGGNQVATHMQSTFVQTLTTFVPFFKTITSVYAHLMARPGATLQEKEFKSMQACILHLVRSMEQSLLEGVCTTHIQAGATAAMLVIYGSLIIVFNLGDTRAVLSRGGAALRLSRDHNTLDAAEHARVTAALAKVPGGMLDGKTHRIAHCRYVPAINMSRSLGDIQFKQSGLVLGVPDAAATRAQVEDQFLIVASDGLWDVMSDQEAVDAVKDVVQTHAHARCDGVEVSSAACAAAEALRALARARGSVDDITIAVNMLCWS